MRTPVGHAHLFRSRERGHDNSVSAVLLIEDDVVLRRVLTRVIEAAGYCVWAASCVEEALAVLAQKGLMPSLILVDRRLPGRFGDTIVRELRERGYEPPSVVLMSGDDVEPPEGFSGVLRKPVTLHDLLANIAARCGRR